MRHNFTEIAADSNAAHDETGSLAGETGFDQHKKLGVPKLYLMAVALATVIGGLA